VNILLLGPRGQVGSALKRTLPEIGSVTALDRDSGGDLEDIAELSAAIRDAAPHVIVNAAAYTHVDRAEDEPERAERVNAEAPRVIATEAARLDAWLVHYSTDYVFDGSGTAPWREDAAPAPLNVYGASKWRGEQAVRISGCRHLLFRTQWIYAERGDNFLRKILRRAAEQDVLEVIADQYGAPTGADLIADVTTRALRLATGGRAAPGTYHLAARGATTWHAYAQFVVEEARRHGAPLRASERSIRAVGTAEFPARARRPRNSRLDVGKLESTLGIELPAWRSGVAHTVAKVVTSIVETAEQPK
jgi:dTDP-4-dehydrorhamnose reductase